MKKNDFSFNVGLFAIGLEAFWEQFGGLEEKLKSYINIIYKKLMVINAK